MYLLYKGHYCFLVVLVVVFCSMYTPSQCAC
jgi:hypothetical protein